MNLYYGKEPPEVNLIRICDTDWADSVSSQANSENPENKFTRGAVRKYTFARLPEASTIQVALNGTTTVSNTIVVGSLFIVKGERNEKLPSDRLFNWIDRAEKVLDMDVEFSDSLDEFNAAVEAMYNADSTSNDDALIADLKAAWNNLTYVDGTKTYKLSLADYGDVNGDGSIDVRDIVRSKKYLAGITNEISDYSLDMNDDGRNAVDDLVAIRNKILNG